MEHAYRVLGWQDDLMENEMPPEWMWHLDDEIVPWFEEVRRKRKEKYGGDDDDDDKESSMMQNEFTKRRR